MSMFDCIYVYLIFLASLGAIFGMTTCLSAHVRDAPDDPTNYFLGGCASGAFLGARSEYLKKKSHYIIVIIAFSSTVHVRYSK